MKIEFKLFWECREGLGVEEKTTSAGREGVTSVRGNFRVLELRSEVNDLPDKENRMWFQRSWSLWTVHGDKNSKYFHSRATQRFRKNNIDDIRNSLGHWTTDSKEVADCLINYCQILVSSTGNSQLEETINIIPCLVTSGMNKQLNSEFMA